MPRKRKKRKIRAYPEAGYFKPKGVLSRFLEEVKLGVDEIEALRLVDLLSLGQVEAAGKMKVSQSTIQRILKSARKKISEALVFGKAIKVEGGESYMPRGRGKGRGGGRMGGPFAAGPGGFCVCTNPDCKNEIAHKRGVPCYQEKCPKCGSPMVRRG